MSFLVSDVIEQARTILNDVRPFYYRYSDEQMLLFFSNTMSKTFMFRPDLFADTIDITTPTDLAVGDYIQKLPQDDQNFLKVLSFKDTTGSKTTPERVSWEAFVKSDKLWASDTPGVPTKFVRDKYSSSTYYLNPPPKAGVEATIQIAAKPAKTFTLSTTVEHPSYEYIPALVDHVVYLAESIEDEFVNNNRAKLYLDSYVNSLGLGEQILRRHSIGQVTNEQEMRNDAQ